MDVLDLRSGVWHKERFLGSVTKISEPCLEGFFAICYKLPNTLRFRGFLVKLMTFIFSIVLMTSFAQAAKKSASTETLLQETTAKYRSTGVVELNVEKTLKTELNPQGQKNTGTIYLSAGLFRIENTEPDKSTLVFDGKFIWNEQPPAPDFPGPVLVSKAKVDKHNTSQIALATLLTKEPITKKFKILKSAAEGDVTIFETEPLQKDSNIQSLILKIITSKKEVSLISYKDEIGNTTEMNFTKTKFLQKKNAKLFKYQPPKGAQVTEL